MKSILSILIFLLLFGSCCSLKDYRCRECNIFKKQLKEQLVYDKASGYAYFNEKAPKSSLYNNCFSEAAPCTGYKHWIHDYQECLNGMTLEELKEYFPFLRYGAKHEILGSKVVFDCYSTVSRCSEWREYGSFYIVVTKKDITLEKLVLGRISMVFGNTDEELQFTFYEKNKIL